MKRDKYTVLSVPLMACIFGLCQAAIGRQVIAHFNGMSGTNVCAAKVDVNDFTASAERLAAPDTNACLGPSGSGFPGDGRQDRALDAGFTGGTPSFLHVPLDKTADFSQGTFEAWVKTAWDWDDQNRHSFINLQMDGQKRNGLDLCYDGRMSVAPGLAFKISDGVDNHCVSYDGRKLGWKKGEWHHVAASWTPHAIWLFADGRLVASATYTEAIFFSPPITPLRIGEPDWLYTTPCAALIDEVRVCDEALYAGRNRIPLLKASLPNRLRFPKPLSDGAVVTASSTAATITRAGDAPRLHDGMYGKAVLIGPTRTTGEVLVTLREPRRISGVRWSRDGRPLRDQGTDQEAGWAWITEMPSDYVIEASADGKTWTEIVKKTAFFIGPAQLSESGIRILHSFAPMMTAKVRLRVTKVFAYGEGAGPQLDEIEILEAGTGRNLARNGTVSTGRSTLLYDYSPAHLVDGRIGEQNAWRAGQPGPVTVTLVLPREAEVHALEWSRSGEGLQTDGTPSEMIVEGQVGGQWIALAHVTGNTQAGPQRTELKPTVTRQVRLRILKTIDNKEATLDEVALY